jgi:hypothetical protein
MKSGAIVIAALALLTATAASAEGNRIGNNVGTGNNGQFNGNMNANGNASSTANAAATGQGGNGQGGNVSNTYKNRVPGSIGAPGLAAGSGTCLGSISGGVSFMGGGFGLGKTYLERYCESRAAADQIYRYGYKAAAIQLLINEHPMVNRAMTMVGSARAVKR